MRNMHVDAFKLRCMLTKCSRLHGKTNKIHAVAKFFFPKKSGSGSGTHFKFATILQKPTL